MQLRPLSSMALPSKAFQLVEIYEVGPYEVKIFDPQSCSTSEFLYFVRPNIDSSCWGMVEEVARELRKAGYLHNLSPNFQELVKTRFIEGNRIIKSRRVTLPEDELRKVVELATYRSINLWKIMSFLLDENVEEIFLDNPAGVIYLDHRAWGRCRTNIRLSNSEISALKTRLRAESGLRLDAINPSLKTELLSEHFQVRFAIDIPPLAIDGIHIDARKLRRKYFTIPELVANCTITSEAAAYLYFYLIRKRNITVLGEPGSGKTTLINALDLLTPPEWRKITVEDVVESIEQTTFGHHQVRLKVEPLESLNQGNYRKTIEIIKLLHRAPDYIYLGEVQTAEHSQAMFHALTAGLRGIQTCHAASPEQAVTRWVVHHNIPAVCMLDLDILVQMKKLRIQGRDARRIVEICEITPPAEPIQPSILTVRLQNVFTWNPQSSSLELTCTLTQTPVFRKVAKLEHITDRLFYDEINTYKTIFETLASRKIFSPNENVKIFHHLHAARSRWERTGTVPWGVLLDSLQRYIEGSDG